MRDEAKQTRLCESLCNKKTLKNDNYWSVIFYKPLFDFLVFRNQITFLATEKSFTTSVSKNVDLHVE